MVKETGIVTNVMGYKGYGFIMSDEDGASLFFHARGLLSPSIFELKEGTAVEYFPMEAPKGPMAIGVRAISDKRKQI